MKIENITYLLARLPIGMSMLGHGLIRLTKLQAFRTGMVNEFSKSILPQALVMPFSYMLPFLEFAVGILLLAGLFTRFACALGSAVIVALIFGSSLLEQCILPAILWGLFCGFVPICQPQLLFN